MEGKMACRIEKIGKFAVPICGHDVLTEFMVQDLRAKTNNGILLYGGLYANELEDRFFWYVSPLSPLNITKIPAMVDNGIKVIDYIAELTKGNRIQTLFEAFEQPLLNNMEDQNVNVLIDLGLLIRTDSGVVRITEKGIELCCVLAHLTVNHRVKPPPQLLNEIFEAFARVGLNLEDIQRQPDTTMTVDSIMEILEEKEELEHLMSVGVEVQKLRDVIQLYLCPPF